MDNKSSVTDFFYNVVPGAIFLLLLTYFALDPILFLDLITSSEGSAFFGFIYLILSFFIGFVFQGVTNFYRYNYWNDKIASFVEKDNKRYKLVKECIPDSKSIDKPKEVLQLIDASLRGEKPTFLPTHFSSRIAFWSNMTICFLLLSIIRFVLIQRYIDIWTSLLIVVSFITYKFADDSFKKYYDSMINVYFMKHFKIKGGELAKQYKLKVC